MQPIDQKVYKTNSDENKLKRGLRSYRPRPPPEKKKQ